MVSGREHDLGTCIIPAVWDTTGTTLLIPLGGSGLPGKIVLYAIIAHHEGLADNFGDIEVELNSEPGNICSIRSHFALIMVILMVESKGPPDFWQVANGIHGAYIGPRTSLFVFSRADLFVQLHCEDEEMGLMGS
ncbi:hypothetical protein Droror1_Dr00002861, partial [Drosera rotundifolia]